ncbi:MAG: DUF433 domain-containing protein, partial [Candidatus Zixiibacteriota bacterium]
MLNIRIPQPDVMMRKHVINGTRITVELILQKLPTGQSDNALFRIVILFRLKHQ